MSSCNTVARVVLRAVPRAGPRAESAASRPTFAIWEQWRRVRTLLPAGSRTATASLAAGSLVAGLLEAGVMVLVVSAALATGERATSLSFEVPVVRSVEVSTRSALLIALVASLIMLATHLYVARLIARLSAEVLAGARHRAIAAFAAATWSRQAADREGALQETVSTLAGESSALVVHLCNVVSAAVGLLALIVAALAVSPLATGLVLCVGGAIMLVLRPIGRITRHRSADYVAMNSEFTEGMSQWSTLAMDLRVFGVEQIEVDRLMDHSRATSEALARSRFVTRAGADLYKDLAILFLVGSVAGLFLMRDVDLVAVGTVVVLIVRSLNYAQRTTASLQQVNELSPNFESLLSRLQSLAEAAEPLGCWKLDAITRLEFREVSYEYPTDRRGLHRVTLNIEAGEAIGVVGPSGGGKTTFAQVLLRLRQPTCGEVLISGIPYEEIDPKSWHKLVSHVPQQPQLFEGSIKENIVFWRPDVTMEQVESAASLAHVIEDIRRLPAGFETQLGPRGSGLSGGQKQRVAIARSLVGQPQLLVLDEPTSALDRRSEHLLQKTIEVLKDRMTLVIIAHRLTTLSSCDRVLAIADGEVLTVGTLDSALAHIALAQDGNV